MEGEWRAAEFFHCEAESGGAFLWCPLSFFCEEERGGLCEGGALLGFGAELDKVFVLSPVVSCVGCIFWLTTATFDVPLLLLVWPTLPFNLRWGFKCVFVFLRVFFWEAGRPLKGLDEETGDLLKMCVLRYFCKRPQQFM